MPDHAEEKLVRLLALKRYELPPPGFFDRLPNRILVNLRAGADLPEAPWWARWWHDVVHEPVVGLSYVALGIGAVLFGVSVLETAVDVHDTDSRSLQGLLQTPQADQIVSAPTATNGSPIYRVSEPSPVFWLHTPPQPAGVLSPLAGSPFAKPEGFEVVPVAYQSGR